MGVGGHQRGDKKGPGDTWQDLQPTEMLGSATKCRVSVSPLAKRRLGWVTATPAPGWGRAGVSPPVSLSPQWDLVCGQRGMKQVAQSLYMAGVLLGGLLFGSLSDR